MDRTMRQNQAGSENGAENNRSTQGTRLFGGGICFEPKWRAGAPTPRGAAAETAGESVLWREMAVSPSVLGRNTVGTQTQAWSLALGTRLQVMGG